MQIVKHRITEQFTAQQEWAERGGLVEQHSELADEAFRRNDEEQQRLADLRGGMLVAEDKQFRAWRDEHPPVPTEEILRGMREYIKAAVAQHERGRA